jgi:hypothetical protein
LSANHRVNSSFVDTFPYPWLFQYECKTLSQRFSLRVMDRNSTLEVVQHILHQH